VVNTYISRLLVVISYLLKIPANNKAFTVYIKIKGLYWKYLKFL